MLGYIACVEFVLFVGLVASRVWMLKRRGIRAFVFGATDKTDFLLVPCVALVAYSILAHALGWPMPGMLTRTFWTCEPIRWVGLGLCAGALFWLLRTLRDFGSSFRVGIDTDAPDKLITSGMFSVSRNPIYVAFFAFFMGLFLVFPDALFLVVVVLFAAALHRQVLREEAFLRAHYGAAYTDYCKRVRRYL